MKKDWKLNERSFGVGRLFEWMLPRLFLVVVVLVEFGFGCRDESPPVTVSAVATYNSSCVYRQT